MNILIISGIIIIALIIGMVCNYIEPYENESDWFENETDDE